MKTKSSNSSFPEGSNGNKSNASPQAGRPIGKSARRDASGAAGAPGAGGAVSGRKKSEVVPGVVTDGPAAPNLSDVCLNRELANVQAAEAAAPNLKSYPFYFTADRARASSFIPQIDNIISQMTVNDTKLIDYVINLVSQAAAQDCVSLTLPVLPDPVIFLFRAWGFDVVFCGVVENLQVDATTSKPFLCKRMSLLWGQNQYIREWRNMMMPKEEATSPAKPPEIQKGNLPVLD